MTDHSTQHTDVIRSHARVLAVIEEYISSGSDDTLIPYIRGMVTPDDDQVFAMMQGSGNEMPILLQFLHVVRGAGLISREEGVELAIKCASSGGFKP